MQINQPHQKSASTGKTKDVLAGLGLVGEEIDIYFKITGRGPISLGEMAVLLQADKDEELTPEQKQHAQQIATNLYEKGLVRMIPGSTPYYTALPPYVALINQINKFKSVVGDIQQNTPQKLEERFASIEQNSAELNKFKQYLTYIQNMKETLPKSLESSFATFENELQQIRKFHEVKLFIEKTRQQVPEDMTKEFEAMRAQMSTLKAEIAIAFEKQFRLGALKTMAERIVARIFETQFEAMIQSFRQRFIETTEEMLDQLMDRLGIISSTAGAITSDLDTAFSDIENGLNVTLEDIESKMGTMYADVQSGINDLKQMFRSEIMETLQKDVIFEIFHQLELSEATMKEFWERSKEMSRLSFKDVWFIRSIEAMKAQINESLSRVKMRLFIVAPTIEDVDLVALSRIKGHVNVRISTYYELENPLHKKKVDIIESDEHPNWYIRLYDRKNLWAINKDFEEIVLCVLSKSYETGITEIAGMGTLLDEHIKLFAAVVEDVWIQSKK